MEKLRSDEKILQDFLLDIECLEELNPWISRFNIFDVLKISRTEIRHSNMLAWLLDPNENHGFSDSFIRGVIQRIVDYDSDGKYDVFKILLLDLHSIEIRREWKNIDVLAISHESKFLFAIENKVGSKEHSDQLNRYREILEREYLDYDKMFVFLTPDGEEPSDVDNWSVLSYNDIIEVLDNIRSKYKVLPDVSLIVDNYLEVIRREVVEDEKLIEVCNKIYAKHSRALDLIFENRSESGSQLSVMVSEVLDKLCAEKGLYKTVTSKKYKQFHSEFMDVQLGSIHNGIGSWGNEAVYQYWFSVEDNRFRLVFELGGWNLSTEQSDTFEKIIKWLKPRDNKFRDFRYKRVWGTGWYEIGDDPEVEVVESKIMDAIRKLKKFEDDFISVVCESDGATN